MASKLKKQKVVDLTEDNSDSFQNAFSSFLSSTQGIENRLTDDIKKIPTGIDFLDAITGGGIPCKFSVFVGKPGGGKSSLLASIIKSGQKKWGNKFIAVYADSEESMSQQRLKDLGCIYPVSIINGLTIEKLFKCVESVCAFKEANPESLEIPSLIVWDSIANTQTEDLMNSEELSNTDGMRRANILSKYIPKYVDRLAKYNVALAAVNQYRDKPNVGGGPQAADMRNMGQDVTTPGGHAVQYNAYLMLDIAQGPMYKNDPYGYPMAPVTVKAIKNKSFTSNVPIVLNFNHTKGFSNFWTNYEFLKTRKYIKAGSRCSLNSYPTVTFFQKNVANLYNTNPEFKEAFNADLKTAFEEFIKEHSAENMDKDSWDPSSDVTNYTEPVVQYDSPDMHPETLEEESVELFDVD